MKVGKISYPSRLISMEKSSSSIKDLEYFKKNVVEANFSEITAFFDNLTEEYSADKIKGSSIELESDKPAEKEFSRLIHNYLASSFALIDQMGNFSEKGESIKHKFYNRNQTVFLKELRNYITHRTTPPIDSRESGAKVLGWKKRKFEIYLERGFLEYLDNRGREEKVRKYINERSILDAEKELRKFQNSLRKLLNEL